MLASRIEERLPDSYLEQIKFVRLLESLFDSPEEMMQAYFDNNLELLVQNMSEYMSSEDAVYLLLKRRYGIRKSKGKVLFHQSFLFLNV